MQYDPKKDFKSDATIKLQWHGEPTRVLVDGEGVKREVATGDVIEVSLDQAKRLIGYSPLWTKEGDKPTKQPYMDRLGKPEKQAKGKKSDQTGNQTGEVLTIEAVDKMKSKPKVIEALKARGASFNDQGTIDELKIVLKESLEAEAKAKTETTDDQTGNQTGADGSANA